MALSDVKFAGPGPWGTGLGRPLNQEEGDGSFYAFREAIQELIDNPVAGVGIADMAVSGRQLYVYLTDATELGPFTLPVAIPRFRGVWAASVSYAAFDIVQVVGTGTFMVLQDHTSASVFDPDVSNSEGEYYVKIGAEGGGGGTALTHVDIGAGPVTLDITHKNKVLMMYDLGLVEILLDSGIFAVDDEIYFRLLGATEAYISLGVGCQFTPGVSDDPGTFTDQYFKLKRVTDNAGDEVWDYIPLVKRYENRVQLISGAMRLIELQDDGYFFNCVEPGGTEILLNTYFFDGGEIRVRQGEAGVVTFTVDTAGSIETPTGFIAETRMRGGVVTCKFIQGVWCLSGDLADAP